MQLSHSLTLLLLVIVAANSSSLDEAKGVSGGDASTASLQAYRGGHVEHRPARKQSGARTQNNVVL